MKKRNRRLRIAIFHDDFSSFGGGEKTVLILAKYFKADLYTYHASQNMKRLTHGTNLYSLSNVAPSNTKEVIRAFKDIKLRKDYDFFIFSGNLCIYIARNFKPNLLYVPMVPHNLYVNFRFRNILNKKRYSFILGKFNSLIANSIFIKNVLSTHFKLNSSFIYHPINVNSFNYQLPNNYWISVNRIDPQKRIYMQFKAFEKNKDKLYVAGDITDYKYYDFLLKNKPNNVELLGNLSENKLADLISKSKGVILTSTKEAFGMAAVEAMASGKPVIAPNEGGYKETIIDGVTGKLIDNINPDKLAKAIIEIDAELKKNPLKYKNACIKQAKKFDTKIFIKKMKEEINKVMEEYERNN